MLTEDDLVAELRRSWTRDTQGVTASPRYPELIRARLAGRRRMRIRAGIGLVAAVTAAVGVITLPSDGRHVDTKILRLSTYTFTLKSGTATSTTCLSDPDAWVSAVTARPAQLVDSSLLRVILPDGKPKLRADGTDCVSAVLTYATKVPTASRSVELPGRPTVRIAGVAGSARVAYIALDDAASAAAARRIGGPTGIPYYVIGEIPADNADEVLVAILQQGDMTALLSIHDGG